MPWFIITFTFMASLALYARVIFMVDRNIIDEIYIYILKDKTPLRTRIFMSYDNQGISIIYPVTALSEAISSLGCRRNSSSGSMLIRQLTEVQLLTNVKTAVSAVFSIHWTGCHLSQPH